MTLVPAYGRDYKSQKEVLNDLKADKDFQISGLNEKGKLDDDGKYVNLSQLKELKINRVQIRYKRLSNVISIEVGKVTLE